jgi:hypothetical protein
VDQRGSTFTLADATGRGSDVTAAHKKQKPKPKKELIVEFVRDNNCDAFAVEKQSQTLKLVKRTMHKSWSASRNTNPPDVHYNSKEFPQ